MIQLKTVFYSLAIAIMVGWLLVIGKAFLLPILISVLVVYILSSSANALSRWPLLRFAPEWMLRLFVVIAFLIILVMLVLMMSANIEQVQQALPTYRANVEKLFNSTTEMFGLSQQTNLEHTLTFIRSKFNIQDVLQPILSSISSFGGQVFLIILYSAFLLAERGQFDDKLLRAFANPIQAERTKDMIHQINRRIGDYLAVKTLANLILAVISLIIMWFIGIDYAVFWAIFIGIFNYIPYVGSIIGVMFPVLLSVAQFGSLQASALAAFLLIGAQTYVGNVLEPRMIGRSVNLSPFVVMATLSLWTALWGIAGAILAVPLTAVIMIVFDSIDSTKPFVVLMSDETQQNRKA